MGHHALKSSPLTLLACWLRTPQYTSYCLLSLVFLRKGKQPIYVKTRKGQFNSPLTFLASCKGHPSCLGITRTCGSLVCVSNHADRVLLGRCGSVSCFFLTQKHFFNLNFIYLKKLPLYCTGFSQTGLLGMKFPCLC